MESVLTLNKITKAYKNRIVLNALDLEVFENERFFILGPSGCGKTTLLRIIAGLDTRHDGTVRISGRDMKGTPPHHRGVGLVFQDGALWPHLTVEKHLSYSNSSRKDKEWQDYLLALTRLDGRRKDYPSSLSGGERQRLAVARALAGKPDLLLFDEPLRNLDKNLAVEMRSAIREILEVTKITSIFVTHDQEEALSLAHRIMLMDQDGPVQIGTPRELFQTPRTLWAASFFGPINCFPTEMDGSGTARTPWGSIETAGDGKAECNVVFRASQVIANWEKRGIPARITERCYQGEGSLLVCEAGDRKVYAVTRSPELDISDEIYLDVLGDPIIIENRSTDPAGTENG